jgi:hypothetical protein
LFLFSRGFNGVFRQNAIRRRKRTLTLQCERRAGYGESTSEGSPTTRQLKQQPVIQADNNRILAAAAGYVIGFKVGESCGEPQVQK